MVFIVDILLNDTGCVAVVKLICEISMRRICHLHEARLTCNAKYPLPICTHVTDRPRPKVLMVSNQDGVLADEFGIPIYDENGEINEDQLDDYQKNPEGLQEGDKITVIGKGLRFYHVRKFQVRWRDIAEVWSGYRLQVGGAQGVSAFWGCSTELLPFSAL